MISQSAIPEKPLITINRDDILRPLSLIVSIIDKKQVMPVLSHVLLQLTGDLLSLAGTDSEIELIQRVPFVHTEVSSLRLIVPARKFYDICRTLDTGAILKLSQRGEQLIVRSERSRFVLSLINECDFPSVEKTEKATFSFSLSASLLNTLLKKTSFSIAQQDVRFFLNGLLLSIQGNILLATGADGHRLSSSARMIDSKSLQPSEALIPRKAVFELIKLLEVDAEALVECQIAENYISVISHAFAFTSKLIGGVIPDYRQAVPKKTEYMAVVPKEALRSALVRIATLCTERNRGARLYFASHLLRLHGTNADRDEAEEEISIDYEGKEIRLACNINYILDVLNVIEDDRVQIHMIDTDKTFLIDSASSPDDHYVIMPLCL